MNNLNIVIYSVLPSPYQRDIFFALASRPEISLKVYYLEMSVDDSPWPKKPLQDYEKVLPGTDIRWGSSRFHLNWHIPDLKQADVVVLNGYQSFVAQWILRTKAKKTPCIFWGEKMLGASTGIKGMLQQTFANSLNHCQAIAAIGEKAFTDYQQRYPNQLVARIPYYCSIDAFQENIPERPRQPITILFCGQMIKRKGVDLLLLAFSRLINEGYNLNLLLVGREAELPEMMKTIPVEAQDKINYAGFQAPDTLPTFFRNADIFILPSRYDGWGVVVNQALGAGLPLLCSDAVGSAADLINNDNGIIFPANSENEIYQALHHYVSEPKRIQLASQASEKQAQNWSPAVGAERWVKLFNQVTSL